MGLEESNNSSQETLRRQSGSSQTTGLQRDKRQKLKQERFRVDIEIFLFFYKNS